MSVNTKDLYTSLYQQLEASELEPSHKKELENQKIEDCYSKMANLGQKIPVTLNKTNLSERINQAPARIINKITKATVGADKESYGELLLKVLYAWLTLLADLILMVATAPLILFDFFEQ